MNEASPSCLKKMKMIACEIEGVMDADIEEVSYGNVTYYDLRMVFSESARCSEYMIIKRLQRELGGTGMPRAVFIIKRR